jgi:hypothetical protein
MRNKECGSVTRVFVREKEGENSVNWSEGGKDEEGGEK